MARLALLAAAALAASLAVGGSSQGSTQQKVELTVTKTAPGVIDAHDQFSYTIKVTNTGDSTLSFVALSDQLPDQVTFKSLTSSRRDFVCTQQAGLVQCQIQALKTGGDSASVTIDVQDNVEGLSSFRNTANASSLRPPTKGSDSVDTIVAGTDLSVAKTGPATATVGDVVPYTITVTNNGQYTARDAMLTDTLPPELQNVSAPGCTVAPGTVSCALGDVAAGDTRTIQVAGQAVVDGTATDQANVATRTSDSNHTNDVATATTVIAKKPPPPPTPSDLAIAMKVKPAQALVGAKVKYRITVSNKGPGPAPATVTDKLPAGMHFLSVTAPCKQKAGFVTCKLGTLADGKKAEPITIVARAVAAGTIVNVATVTGGRDPVLTNDVARVIARIGKKPTATQTTQTVTTPTVTTPTVTTPTVTTPTVTTPTTTQTTTTTAATPPPKHHPKLAPKVTLSPPVGPPGAVTQVTGSGFPPKARIRLRWSKGIGTAAVTTDKHGRLAASMLIFESDVLGPRFLIASPGSGTASFKPPSARFLVALRALQPPDFETH